MPAENREPDELFTHLSEAIMNAISRSDEVIEILTGLHEKGLVRTDSVFNLLISLDELAAKMEIKANEDNPIGRVCPAPEPARLQAKSFLTNQLIDGRVLSENEKRFEEFCSAVFDEVNWLKKVGIKF
ncbi:MAG: hypothetical protein ACE5ER_05715 [Nitrospinaceae bacterium]